MTKKEYKPSEAIFAGGCFWCMEKDFEKLNGVIEVISGYIGGTQETATYPQVSSGKTKHKESIKVIYNPENISYKQLLEAFWTNIDPFNNEGQFCDKGSQYTAVIYYGSTSEKKRAQESKKKIETYLKKSVVTEIEKQSKFYDAEEYHQNYYKTHSFKYKTYRYFCGRDKQLRRIWNSQKLEL